MKSISMMMISLLMAAPAMATVSASNVKRPASVSQDDPNMAASKPTVCKNLQAGNITDAPVQMASGTSTKPKGTVGRE